MSSKNSSVECYEALVPDTLDLARRAQLALNGLARTLDVENNYEMYFMICYTADPPYMAHFCTADLAYCTAKYLESFPMLRLMSGCREHQNTENALLEAQLALINGDGLFYVPPVDVEKTPWRVRGDYPVAHEPLTSPFGDARLMLALMAWFQRDQDKTLLKYLKGLADGLTRTAIFKKDYAYYPEGKVGLEFSYLKHSGYQYTAEPVAPDEGEEGCVQCYQAAPLRALTRWYAMSGDSKAWELATKLVQFVLRSNLWGADAESAWVKGSEHGHFRRHFHGNCIALRGLLDYAHLANDQGLKEFVRAGYEYGRSWGIGRIGSFGDGYWGPYTESCDIADMVALAIRLSDYGLGDYWDDVDQYVRNQLAEAQILRADLLQQVAQAAVDYPDAWKKYPAKQPPGFPWGPEMLAALMKKTGQSPICDNVIEKSLGLFAGFSTPTALAYPVSCGCCNGNSTQALYYAWESIVRGADSQAQVNLLLNRTSSWLDVDSFLPYEGKVIIHNKTVRRLSVRIPGWVDKKAVKATLDRKPARFFWVQNFLVFEEVNPGDVLTIEFPIAEDKVICTQPFDKTYKLHFRGSTVVDVAPRENNPTAYPIYLRDHYQKGPAPLKKTLRFVPPIVIDW